MGNSASDDHAFFHALLCAAESSGAVPDVGIDFSLVKYSGLDSGLELKNAIGDMYSKTPDYLQSLGSSLAAFDKVPNAVGLAALVLSITLELIIKSQEEREKEDHTLYMLRRVFAEETAAGVRDLMEEYMKRLGMYLHQPARALEETRRLEQQLSEQLTRLKNSMLHDNQMSSRSLKHWTNGAAFHLQMLIHEARLRIQNTTEHDTQLQVHLKSILSVLSRYQFDLGELLKQYKIYKKATIKIHKPSMHKENLFYGYFVQDYELKKETPRVFTHCGKNTIFSWEWNRCKDEYVDYMFDNCTHLKELKSYFSDLEKNLKDLILQNDEFNIQKVLPVSDKQDT